MKEVDYKTAKRLNSFQSKITSLFCTILVVSLAILSSTFVSLYSEIAHSEQLPQNFQYTEIPMTVENLLWKAVLGGIGVIGVLFGLLMKCWMGYNALVREIVQHTIEMKSILKALTPGG